MKNTINHTTHIITHTLKPITTDALSIETLSLLKTNGSLYPEAVCPTIDQKTAVKIYHTMQFIRLLDDRMQACQRQGRISFYMQCLGEEAAVTGSAAGLHQQDMIFAQYREQAALHYRGFTLQQFMNQLFSNQLDLGKGRQMPVHYGSADLNYMTISSPLATQIPQASGYAYGQRLRKDPYCTLCYFGEGAASEGDFHAGLNMAAVHQAPVIFFCRNNGYAISTPTYEQFIGDGIASRGIGYGIDTLRVDGNDVLAVYAATQYARNHAMTQHKPFLIEAINYRSAAHSTSDDPIGYRTKEEEKKFSTNNAFYRYETFLIQKNWIDLKEEIERTEQIKQDILTDVKRAEKIEKPIIDQMIEDVYDKPTTQLFNQLDDLKKHIQHYPELYSHVH
ncbi:MAG: thiamine pyrophosphate-dependent dehydrogenase E1 component subunit alpha [Endozoicomonadaceae bacterium]|nr:thiamine pyrophosphate-dependent dehydrogenase E1 component subunit alpha [Endozoicomonadaceae bacterium]MBE8233326.1 thiamine pyrophosphate-dependent dehydrogenase E1 component subunit alpha [Endozoicomonadaceae bacterium]